MGRKRIKQVEPPVPTYRSGKPVIFTISWGVRKLIIKRDGFVCRYCGDMITRETHTIDHIIPASKGGDENPRNLVMCCGTCNKYAKNLVFDSFEAKQAYLVAKKLGK